MIKTFLHFPFSALFKQTHTHTHTNTHTHTHTHTQGHASVEHYNKFVEAGWVHEETWTHLSVTEGSHKIKKKTSSTLQGKIIYFQTHTHTPRNSPIKFRHTQTHTHMGGVLLSVAPCSSRGTVISEINDSNKQQQEDAGWLAKAIRLFIRFIGTKTQFSLQQKTYRKTNESSVPELQWQTHRKLRGDARLIEQYQGKEIQDVRVNTGKCKRMFSGENGCESRVSERGREKEEEEEEGARREKELKLK